LVRYDSVCVCMAPLMWPCSASISPSQLWVTRYLRAISKCGI